MTLTARPRRPAVAARRVGYGVAAVVNAAILYMVNVSPGWQVLPFLTDDMSVLVGVINASIVVHLVADMVYVVADPRWLKSLGDLLTTTVGLAALVRIWQVFPFAFTSSAVDWPLVARVALGVAIGGSVIAIVVALVSLVTSIGRDLS